MAEQNALIGKGRYSGLYSKSQPCLSIFFILPFWGQVLFQCYFPKELR